MTAEDGGTRPFTRCDVYKNAASEMRHRMASTEKEINDHPHSTHLRRQLLSE